MIRLFALTLVLAAPLALAQVVAPVTPVPTAAPSSPTTTPPAPLSPPPATRPAAPATRPSPAQLHQQAFDFMRQDRFDKATPLLNRAYNETPTPQRSRALVLNRALLDLIQKTTPLRGIKDIYQHLARNSAPDEQASNLLGSLLDQAAQNPKWRDGPIYAEAFREFARREAVLERHRQGFKRWGNKWITQAEYDEIKRKDKELEEQIAQESHNISRLIATLNSLRQQYQTAAAQLTGFGRHVHIRRPNEIAINRNDCSMCRAVDEAQRSVNDVNAEMRTATAQYERAKARYEQLQKRATKPTWPARYDPIDPDAPPPQPPKYPGAAALEAAAAATTAPATTQPQGLAQQPEQIQPQQPQQGVAQ